MAKGGKEKSTEPAATNPESTERKRLRNLAFSEKLLSESPANGSSVALKPSKTVIKHHGRDIIKKSNRKNRFLFSFPGLLAPISGGKLGELKHLGSKNPILYLDFPQGQMKLFGTIVYPKNRYLTLQFSRGGKNVMCEDYFDTMIVFSDAWWIGRKEDNPEEVRLDFPDDLHLGQQNEYDFTGGAGSTCERTEGVNRSETTAVKHKAPVHEVEDDLSDSENDSKDLILETATRHSTRTAGKSFKFAESSSADDAFDNNTETSDGDETGMGAGSSISKDATESTTGQLPKSGVSETKLKDGSRSKHSSLVQATISTLFKKKEEKMTVDLSLHSTPSKVSKKSLKEPGSDEKIDQPKVRASTQKGETVKERKNGARTTTKRKRSENSSDEEWGA